MKHYVRFENGSQDVMGPTIGPFDNCIQLTYTSLQGVNNSGNNVDIAYCDDGMWTLEGHKVIPPDLFTGGPEKDRDEVAFSDVIIFSTP